jgi:hypothetical protein
MQITNRKKKKRFLAVFFEGFNFFWRELRTRARSFFFFLAVAASG